MSNINRRNKDLVGGKLQLYLLHAAQGDSDYAREEWSGRGFSNDWVDKKNIMCRVEFLLMLEMLSFYLNSGATVGSALALLKSLRLQKIDVQGLEYKPFCRYRTFRFSKWGTFHEEFAIARPLPPDTLSMRSWSSAYSNFQTVPSAAEVAPLPLLPHLEKGDWRLKKIQFQAAWTGRLAKTTPAPKEKSDLVSGRVPAFFNHAVKYHQLDVAFLLLKVSCENLFPELLSDEKRFPHEKRSPFIPIISREADFLDIDSSDVQKWVKQFPAMMGDFAADGLPGLVQYMSRIIDINSLDLYRTKFPPLHRACASVHLLQGELRPAESKAAADRIYHTICALVSDAGADVDLIAQEMSPMHLAAVKNNSTALRALKFSGANVNLGAPLTGAKQRTEVSPVYCSLAAVNFSSTQTLLRLSLDPQAAMWKPKRDLLPDETHREVQELRRSGKTYTEAQVKALGDKMVSCGSIFHIWFDQIVPLHYGGFLKSKQNEAEMITSLMLDELRCDADTHDVHGYSPLMYALKHEDLSLAKLLVEKAGANINYSIPGKDPLNHSVFAQCFYAGGRVPHSLLTSYDGLPLSAQYLFDRGVIVGLSEEERSSIAVSVEFRRGRRNRETAVEEEDVVEFIFEEAEEEEQNCSDNEELSDDETPLA